MALTFEPAPSEELLIYATDYLKVGKENNVLRSNEMRNIKILQICYNI